MCAHDARHLKRTNAQSLAPQVAHVAKYFARTFFRHFRLYSYLYSSPQDVAESTAELLVSSAPRFFIGGSNQVGHRSLLNKTSVMSLIHPHTCSHDPHRWRLRSFHPLTTRCPSLNTSKHWTTSGCWRRLLLQVCFFF